MGKVLIFILTFVVVVFRRSTEQQRQRRLKEAQFTVSENCKRNCDLLRLQILCIYLYLNLTFLIHNSKKNSDWKYSPDNQMFVAIKIVFSLIDIRKLKTTQWIQGVLDSNLYANSMQSKTCYKLFVTK